MTQAIRPVVKPLVPYAWPQDNLTVPYGYGDMTPMNRSNAERVYREPFAYTLVQANITSPSVTTIIKATQPDGDFWCNDIALLIATSAAPTALGVLLSPMLNIFDLRTGYDLSFPFVRANTFADELVSTMQPWLPTTSLQGELSEPYCFTRNGGIKVVVTNDTGVQLDLHMVFFGWKEYQNASA